MKVLKSESNFCSIELSHMLWELFLSSEQVEQLSLCYNDGTPGIKSTRRYSLLLDWNA
jgi:hypothetical protein